MRSETDVDASPAAMEQRIYQWMDRVEASAERVHRALLGPDRSEVPRFIDEMEAVCRESSGLAATPAMLPRLGALRKRLTLVRSLLRQAVIFREHLEAEGVLGYTPQGLERTLQ